jgi:hypothetical protein
VQTRTDVDIEENLVRQRRILFGQELFQRNRFTDVLARVTQEDPRDTRLLSLLRARQAAHSTTTAKFHDERYDTNAPRACPFA